MHMAGFLCAILEPTAAAFEKRASVLPLEDSSGQKEPAGRKDCSGFCRRDGQKTEPPQHITHEALFFLKVCSQSSVPSPVELGCWRLGCTFNSKLKPHTALSAVTFHLKVCQPM